MSMSGQHGMDEAWLERAGQFSPLYTLVRENLEKHRVSVMPGAIARCHGNDRWPPGLYDRTKPAPFMADFHRRLEAIVSGLRADRLLADLDYPTGQRRLAPEPILRKPID